MNECCRAELMAAADGLMGAEAPAMPREAAVFAAAWLQGRAAPRAAPQIRYPVHGFVPHADPASRPECAHTWEGDDVNAPRVRDRVYACNAPPDHPIHTRSQEEAGNGA